MEDKDETSFETEREVLCWHFHTESAVGRKGHQDTVSILDSTLSLIPSSVCCMSRYLRLLLTAGVTLLYEQL